MRELKEASISPRPTNRLPTFPCGTPGLPARLPLMLLSGLVLDEGTICRGVSDTVPLEVCKEGLSLR